jgi:Phospholipase_D-nuclease N-terminal/Short C-terminal domain
MTVAADYPLLNIIWTMIVFFGFVIWIWLLFAVLVDVFRRNDVSGWGKAGWCVLIIFLPLFGVLIYLIAHGSDMAERRAKDVQTSQAQFDQHIRTVAGGPAAQIKDAKDLLDQGVITQAEFDQLKQAALSGHATTPPVAAAR